MRNPTFLGQLRKTTALPFLPAEAAFGLVVFVVTVGWMPLLVALALAGLVVVGLIVWRRGDAYRTDYFVVFLRNRWRPRGIYNLAEDE